MQYFIRWYNKTGPGSGNHWSDWSSNETRDYFLMGNSAFAAKYGVNNYDVSFRNGQMGHWVDNTLEYVAKHGGAPTVSDMQGVYNLIAWTVASTSGYASGASVSNQYAAQLEGGGYWIDLTTDVQMENRYAFVYSLFDNGNAPRTGNYVGNVLGYGGWLSEAAALSAYGTSMHGVPRYTGPKAWAGQVAKLNKIGKVAGNAGLGLTALSAGYAGFGSTLSGNLFGN